MPSLQLAAVDIQDNLSRTSVTLSMQGADYLLSRWKMKTRLKCCETVGRQDGGAGRRKTESVTEPGYLQAAC